ncbi:hypothetical protein [Streptomyces sp. NPDC059781]|uniref:hypothetical protein n=1 Tax=Streptomyces sp. NPDC059781 TaxID=3346943 RepID=UPI0036461FD4
MSLPLSVARYTADSRGDLSAASTDGGGRVVPTGLLQDALAEKPVVTARVADRSR